MRQGNQRGIISHRFTQKCPIRTVFVTKKGFADDVVGEPFWRKTNDSGSQARSIYLPVRVSILSFSPVLMNRGAWTVMPVSITTGF